MGPRTHLEDRLDERDQVILPRQVFHVLVETPCPYLADRYERKLLTELKAPEAVETYSLLSRAGFRRSHNYAYRPACSGCAACVPVRVRARDFTPSPSLKRVAAANRDLLAAERRPVATPEQYRLFDRYIDIRHGDGEMAGMGYGDYRAMIEESCLDTTLTELRDADGGLVAVCLTDWLEDGPSAVYSFFDPAQGQRSLGTFCVLWLIEEARRRDLPHVYLGYWIAQSGKMAYKARFRPLEGLGVDGWRVLAP
jgi:arginyl-tRNA--protein-N-Asp/Glu arginylyltransferase